MVVMTKAQRAQGPKGVIGGSLRGGREPDDRLYAIVDGHAGLTVASDRPLFFSFLFTFVSSPLPERCLAGRRFVWCSMHADH